MKKPWSAPHKPVRSCDLSTHASLGPILSDHKIDQYIRDGRYGPDLQHDLLAQDKRKKTKRIPHTTALQRALDLLRSLT